MEKYDVTGAIIKYEEGDISEEEYYELFQYLVDSGMAWELQGFYGRQAAMMLEEGHLLPPDRVKPAESKEEPSMTKPKRKSRSKKQVGALVKMKSRKIAGLGIILARVDDLPHDEHPDYGPMMIEMKNKGVVGWGVMGDTSHHNFVLVQWFSTPSEYSSVPQKVNKQWYPDKWVSVVSPAPNRGIFNEA